MISYKYPTSFEPFFPAFQLPESAPKFTVPLSDKTVFVDDEVTLECEVNNPQAEVKWYKNGKLLKGTGKKVKIVQEGTVHKLLISSATPTQAAEYSAKVGKDTTKGTLTVEGNLFRMIYACSSG